MELPDSQWKQAFRRQLKRWYQRHARDLPWRRSQDPYRVWVSEIMLQQTQVATVIPYFERFIQAFPTIEALAKAEEQTVLRHWEGLGYYRRARQLHRAARQVVEQHGGRFPEDAADVDALPGIGRYTRGAILSIAFDQRQPILEANTIRLYCRLLQYDGDPNARVGTDLLWRFAEEILPQTQVGAFNQAMMELGSAICTPKQPRCLLCPVASLCPTRAAGQQEAIPIPKRKKQYEDRREVAVVVRKRNQVLLRRCQEGERWAGLWDFPRFEQKGRNHNAVQQVAELTGIQIDQVDRLTTFHHGVTKYRITLQCYRADFVSGRCRRDAELVWVHRRKLSEYPLSVTGRKIAKLLEET